LDKKNCRWHGDLVNRKHLIEIALRVLVHEVSGGTPAVEDVETLKRNALPEEANLDTDRIACQVVAREIRRVTATRARGKL
jgi:hypothetical protein